MFKNLEWFNKLNQPLSNHHQHEDAHKLHILPPHSNRKDRKDVDPHSNHHKFAHIHQHDSGIGDGLYLYSPLISLSFQHSHSLCDNFLTNRQMKNKKTRTLETTNMSSPPSHFFQHTQTFTHPIVTQTCRVAVSRTIVLTLPQYALDEWDTLILVIHTPSSTSQRQLSWFWEHHSF